MAEMVSTGTLRITVEAETFARGKLGPVTGVIFFDLETVQFPSTGWSDFPITLVSWWLDDVLQLMSSPKTERFFEFMDGPYRVNVQSAGAHDWRLQFIDDHGSGEVRAEWQGPSRDVLKQLLSAANLIDRTCTAHGWESTELSELRRWAADLRRLGKQA